MELSTPSHLAYAALISYHSDSDGSLSRELRNSLVRFAKPFWRLRAIRVFRDVESGLGTPDVRKGLRRALRSSRYLILLARPESAAAPYVRWEIGEWIAGARERGEDPAEHLVVVRTGGRIAWNDSGALDWSATDALPRELVHPWLAVGERPIDLARVLVGTPRVEDLSWAHDRAVRSRRPTDFGDVVASISSILRGIPLEDLRSEELRQRRNAMRAALMTAAFTFGLAAFAFWQWRTAVHERENAEVATWAERGARARLLAAASSTQVRALEVGIDAVAPALATGREPPAEAVDGLHTALRGHRMSLRVPVADRPVLAACDLGGDGGLVVACRGGGLYRFGWSRGTRSAGSADAGEHEPICVAPAADGEVVATIAREGDRVRWWWAATLMSAGATSLGGGDASLAAAVDPSRGRIAVGMASGMVHVVSSHTAPARSVAAGVGPIVGLAWNPAGTLVACLGQGGSVALLAESSGTVTPLDVDFDVTCMAFSGNDQLTIAAAELVMRVDLSSGAVTELGRVPNKVSRMRVAPDGRCLACYGFQPTVSLWLLDAPNPKLVQLQHGADVEQVVFAPKPPLVLTATSSGNLHAWDRRSGRPVTSHRAHAASIEWLAFDAAGRRFASAGFDGTLRIGDLEPRDDGTDWTRHTARVSGLVCRGSRWLSVGWDGFVQDHAGPADSVSPCRHAAAVFGLVATADRRTIATLGFDGVVWLLAGGDVPRHLAAHRGKVLAAVFVEAKGILVTGGEDGILRRFAMADGADLGVLAEGPAIACMAVAGSGDLVAVGATAGPLRVFDVVTGRPIATFAGHGAPPNDICGRPRHAEIVSTGGNRAVHWRATDGAVLGSLTTGEAVTLDVDVNPAGELAAIVRSDGKVDLWHLGRHERVATLDVDRDITTVRFSRSGRLLAIAGHEGAVDVWTGVDGKRLMTLQTGAAERVWAIDFADDERMLLTGDERGRVLAFALDPTSLLRTARGYLPADVRR